MEKLIEAEQAILGAHAAESQAVGWRNVRLCFGLPGVGHLNCRGDHQHEWASEAIARLFAIA